MNVDANLKKAVWYKAQIVLGEDSTKRRKDLNGAWISFDKYGDRSNQGNEGWEIDHIFSKSANGSDELWNLQPLHWKNNEDKGDILLEADWKPKLNITAKQK